MKPIRRSLYFHLENSCFFFFFISVLIVYLLKKNTTFIDAYHISSNPSFYLDFTWINLVFVSSIHSVKWLEICASPHKFQVNKGKSFSLTGVGCLRTTEDLHSETMRMETGYKKWKRFDCVDCRDYGTSIFSLARHK